MKRISGIWLAMMLMMLLITSVNVQAANVTYPEGMTEDMATADYWKEQTYKSNKLLSDYSSVDAVNEVIASTSNTNVVDLTSMTELPSGSSFFKFERALYIAGEEISEADMLASFTAGYEAMPLTYAVGVKHTGLKTWPLNETLGYTADDPDDENWNSILEVNEPVLIGGKCTVGEHVFYYARSNNCDGWVDGNDVAICASKSEWLEAWQVNTDGDDFVTVTADKIRLPEMLKVPAISNVELYMGTTLKLVPDAAISEKIGEREGPFWFSHVVYLPTRDENGNYVREVALIPQHENVSVGFLPVTQANVLDLAFGLLGNRYGWGGMMGAYDASLFNRAIFRCFGYELPRNTTWQKAIPNRYQSIEEMTPEEKQAYLNKLPVGTMLHFPGQTMIYVGTVDGVGYAISSAGVLSDSATAGELDASRHYTVMVTPLTVRRRTGATWLESLTGVVQLYDAPAPMYTVTLDYGGDFALAFQQVDAGEQVSIPTEYSQEGYSFAGWYMDASYTTPFDFETPVYQDMTLYAKWNKNTYTVKFNTAGGTAVASQSVKYGEKAKKPTNPTRDGYVFAGWYANTAGTTAFDFSKTVTKNTTVYAKWTAGKVTTFKVTALSKKAKLTWATNLKLTSSDKVIIYGAKGSAALKKIATLAGTKKTYTVTKLTSKKKYRFQIYIKKGSVTKKSAVKKVTIK